MHFQKKFVALFFEIIFHIQKIEVVSFVGCLNCNDTRGGGGGGGFFTDNITTPTKVVLSCFGLLVGLWQLKEKNTKDQLGILHRENKIRKAKLQ